MTMFPKISRYYKLPDVVTVDASGRSLQAKPIRLLPNVSGQFEHTLETNDRLDHLAFKYYKQPRKWWRICDANPEFMSPLALLGHEPLAVTQFSLTFEGPNPPWADMLARLSQELGVIGSWLDSRQQTATVQLIQGAFRFSMPLSLLGDLESDVYSLDLRTEFEANALLLSGNVIVFSEDNNWLIVGEGADETFMVVPIPDVDPVERRLDVFNCFLHYLWSVIVSYNQLIVSAGELADVIDAVGFEVGQQENIGRVGKPIIIPPNSIR